MSTPYPQTVREIAAELILENARRILDIDRAVVGRFGRDGLTKHEHRAWCSAVNKAIWTARVTVSWPDEQQAAAPVSGEQQDGVVERLWAAVDDDADVLAVMWELFPKLRSDLRAVLTERNALAARVAELQDQAAFDDNYASAATELLAAVVAPTCETDRYGNCATHGVLALEAGSQCPHVLARAFLSSSRLHLKAQQPTSAGDETDGSGT